jgi:glycosyltransferase involved in cell wall biosynthesis
VGGIENVVIPGQTALLSEVGNVQKFCENLLEMVENDVMRMSFGQQGPAYVKDKFHYRRLVNDMRKLYFDLLAQNA